MFTSYWLIAKIELPNPVNELFRAHNLTHSRQGLPKYIIFIARVFLNLCPFPTREMIVYAARSEHGWLRRKGRTGPLQDYNDSSICGVIGRCNHLFGADAPLFPSHSPNWRRPHVTIVPHLLNCGG